MTQGNTPKRNRKWFVISSPQGMIGAAVERLPPLKYALGIGAIIAIVAIVKSWGINIQTGAAATVIMIVLMASLVVFSALAGRTRHLGIAPLVLAWSAIVLTIVVAVLIVTSLFFNWPRSFAGQPPTPPYTAAEQTVREAETTLAEIRGDWEALPLGKPDQAGLDVGAHARSFADILERVSDKQLDLPRQIVKHEYLSYAYVIAASMETSADRERELTQKAISNIQESKKDLVVARSQDALASWAHDENREARLNALWAIALCLNSLEDHDMSARTEAQKAFDVVPGSYASREHLGDSPYLRPCLKSEANE